LVMLPRSRDFDALTTRYDAWFERHRAAYLSELKALRALLPKKPFLGLEVGVGTGRFASALGVQVGVDPAWNCLRLAKGRGVQVIMAVGEELPFRNGCFDLVLMVVTFCFLSDPQKALSEAKRVLRPGGLLLMGIIDRESPLGQLYARKKAEGKPFYRDADFYTPGEVISMLAEKGFRVIKVSQTVFRSPEEMEEVEEPAEGFGQGSFVAISALRP